MKLYYMPGACSLATHIVLEWAGATYETHRLSHDELKQAAFLNVNPAGAVPALALDERVLTQNTAVLTYLAETHPEAQLIGTTAADRAAVNLWLGLVNSDMHPAFKPLFGATGYLGDEDAIEATKAHAKQTIRAQFERIDQQLQGRDWLVGTRSIADPYLFVMTRWANMMTIDITDLTHVSRFAQHMNADAGVRTALADEGLL